jgi:hypothetical protein
MPGPLGFHWRRNGVRATLGIDRIREFENLIYMWVQIQKRIGNEICIAVY